MTTSRNNVKFYLPHRYFNQSTNGMSRYTCQNVLRRAFGLPQVESEALMTGNPDGFHITCRLDQFACFIVYRHEAGECINGIRDLSPTLSPATEKEESLYETLSRKSGLSQSNVSALLYAARELGLVLRGKCKTGVENHVDVSKRPAL